MFQTDYPKQENNNADFIKTAENTKISKKNHDHDRVNLHLDNYVASQEGAKVVGVS